MTDFPRGGAAEVIVEKAVVDEGKEVAASPVPARAVTVSVPNAGTGKRMSWVNVALTAPVPTVEQR